MNLKLFFLLLSTIPLVGEASESVATIEVSGSSKSTDLNIYEGKKVSRTQLNSLPQVPVDSTRQVLVKTPGLHTPEQTTEPWMIMNYRGLGTPQEAQGLLILQDGLPVTLDMYGSPEHYYAPPSPLMESVEVIAGGSALLYGPTPVGTVNYLTPALSPDMPLTGRLNVTGGSYNLFSTVNTLSGSTGRLSYHLGYHRKQGDGFQRTNADFVANNIQGKFHYFLDHNLILKSSFSAHESDYGMPGGMALNKASGFNTWGDDNRKATRPYNRLRLGRIQLMLGAEKKLSAQSEVDVQLWANAYRKYNKTQLGSGFGKFPTSQNNTINTTQAYSFNCQIKYKRNYGPHSLTLGYLSYNTNSPAVNERGNAPDSNHGTVTSRLYRTTRTQVVMAENLWKLGKWSLVPAVRLENITLQAENNDKQNALQIDRSDTYNVTLGGLGATYEVSDSAQFFVNASQGFRPLGYEEVLSQGNPNYTINGDLKSSYSYTIETGFQQKADDFIWGSSIYFIRRENILASSGNVLSNAAAAEYEGLEAFVELKKLGDFEFFSNLNVMNARYKRGSFSGKTPAHAPASLWKAGLVYNLHDVSRLSLLNTYVHEHFSDDAHSANYRVPSYHLQDLLGEYFLSQAWSLNGGVLNLMDYEYYSRVMPTGVMPAMGRSFFIGLNYFL
jgi:Fe(3+) dicitrate transport protein